MAAGRPSLVQGSSLDTGYYNGCVTAATPLSVSAIGTTAMTKGSDTYPLSAVSFGMIGTPPGGTLGCTQICTLDVSRTLFTGATAGTVPVYYGYRFKTPSAQPVGSYTGGVVTFTASA